jgi:hypothetical protein
MHVRRYKKNLAKKSLWKQIKTGHPNALPAPSARGRETRAQRGRDQVCHSERSEESADSALRSE